MRVLVIEDFEPLRSSLAQGLREAGFAVDAEADGESGLWQAESNDYDVVILDLMLPRLDGLSILKRLRANGHRAHVLVLTARDTSQDRIKGLDLGADDYLVKPFVFAELLARVRALVRRRYESKSPLIRIADMEIDTLTRRVNRGGSAVELSAREYALLELLAMRAGQVVTRTEIWEHVYDANSEAESNVVDVFIGHLRRKVERSGLPRLIHTRRGLGYVLGEEI
ncbi:MAG TPA: response regulator [Tepidisphaeraceae bacterium]|jgi:DNA-binding response OmpR family regulator|nr:response regulator [Tepidisphaeraceae bacterium]